VKLPNRHRAGVLLVVAMVALVTVSADAATKAKKTTRKPVASSSARPTATPTTAVPTAVPTITPTVAPTTTVPVTGSINVFAAASLTASFTDIAAAFERANPGAKVTVNFGGSSSLVTQIQNGAPADVFASADTNNMDKLAKANLLDGPAKIFTRNRLMIVVPRGNPLRIQTLADLAKPEIIVGLGAPGVPAGDYARDILSKAGIDVKPKTLESSVSAIVTKAALREIDAGIVYVTDVAIDEYRVDGVAIPDAQNIVATYPVAALAASKNAATAKGFVAFTQSAAAQSILAKYKFLPLR
jgi:molybdate transport system substrate-binding protein